MILDLKIPLRAGWSAILLAIAPIAGHARSVDIVFVYDNSASMWAHYAKIDSTTGDTAFYYRENCSPTGLPTPPGAPLTYSTLTGPRDIHLIDPKVLCRETAGDPFVVRTALVSRAIDYLAAHAPDANAGALAFAHTVEHRQPPLPLSVPGNADSVKASLALDSLNSTNYAPALAQATQWLRDPALSPHPGKAIVFLSDGQPTDKAAASNWLRANTGIPIYGIALGDTSTILSFLMEMADSTGGRYFAMPPRDLSRMDQVMEAILAESAGLAPFSRPPRMAQACGASCPAVDAAGRRSSGSGRVPRFAYPARR